MLLSWGLSSCRRSSGNDQTQFAAVVPNVEEPNLAGKQQKMPMIARIVATGMSSE